MATRLSLRDYQRDLAARLQEAGSARVASKLGVQAGGQRWLVDLRDAGEVLPVPAVTPVPLTRPWFRGVASIRGNLVSVIDFGAFLGLGATAPGEQARLLLLNERFRMGCALLVERSLGLRGEEQLSARARAEVHAPWLRAEYDDAQGEHWRELDLALLVQDLEFLSVAA
ncbi:MAG: chemotaxis protein CheW [Betaproteobacteria bacterium]|nr:chemotaxis protein CheW [Betaproteobacteria bacterium]